MGQQAVALRASLLISACCLSSDTKGTLVYETLNMEKQNMAQEKGSARIKGANWALFSWLWQGGFYHHMGRSHSVMRFDAEVAAWSGPGVVQSAQCPNSIIKILDKSTRASDYF